MNNKALRKVLLSNAALSFTCGLVMVFGNQYLSLAGEVAVAMVALVVGAFSVLEYKHINHQGTDNGAQPA